MRDLIDNGNDKSIIKENSTADTGSHTVPTLFNWCLRRIIQDAKLTQAACMQLPTSLHPHLVSTHCSLHYSPDPRVLDVLLRHWRHSSLYYPACHHHHHHHHHHQQQEPGQYHELSGIALREALLHIAIAFINAAGCITLYRLRTLYLTSLYTAEPELTLLVKSYTDTFRTGNQSPANNNQYRLYVDILLMRDVDSVKTSLALSRLSHLRLCIRRISLFACTLPYVVQLIALLHHKYVRAVSITGMRLDACQLSTLCNRLSSLKHLTSLSLSNNFIDLEDHTALKAVCSLLSTLPALVHLDLSDICLTECLQEILQSIVSDRFTSIQLTQYWLSLQDLSALQLFQQRNSITVTLN